ncbi:hypothetical protein [Calothrix sp. FACHB-1219]|nr:hypothetical protein [Calothrix sp. FACHB-1219]
MTYVTAHSVKQRQYIDFILEELLLVTSSNRAVLGLFHNGTRLGAISFTSMSVFHEAVDANTNSLKSRFKNVPIEKIEEEILKGLNSPHEFIKYSIDQELPPGCLKYLNRNGIHTVYSRVLMNSNKGMYGILEIQYLSQPSNDFLLDKSRINQVELIFSKLTKAIEAIRDNKKFQVDVDSII